MKLLNAFSLQMLKIGTSVVSVSFMEVPEDSLNLQKLESCIGHADTAMVLGVEMHRVNVTLQKGEKFIVAQLQGGRLPEGSTTLPSGFKFKFVVGEVL